MFIRPPYRPSPPSLASGLVGWWPMDDLVSNDYSGRNNNPTALTAVTPVGGIAKGVNGQQRGAFKFNGTTSVVTLPAMVGTSNISIAAWINPSSLAGTLNTIFGGTTNPTGSAIIFNLNTSNQIQFFSNELTSVGNSGVVALSVGVWYHVCVTFDNSSFVTKFYLNAADVSSVNNTAAISNTHTDNRIGMDTVNAGALFAGTIDDVRLYNRILAPGEVLALYAEAFRPSFETLALMRAPIAGGFTAKFRRTFSPMGTHVGGRQRQGWAA